MSLYRVLIVVPVAKQLDAGKEYTKISKDPADDNSFTRGFFDAKGVEYAIAIWPVNFALKDTRFAALKAMPGATFTEWPDDPAVDPVAKLAGMGIARPVVDIAGNLVQDQGGEVKIVQ